VLKVGDGRQKVAKKEKVVVLNIAMRVRYLERWKRTTREKRKSW